MPIDNACVTGDSENKSIDAKSNSPYRRLISLSLYASRSSLDEREPKPMRRPAGAGEDGDRDGWIDRLIDMRY